MKIDSKDSEIHRENITVKGERFASSFQEKFV